MFSAVLVLAVYETGESFYALYADPGAGALAWQLLLAAIFGGMLYARSLLVKLKILRSRKEKKLDDKQD